VRLIQRAHAHHLDIMSSMDRSEILSSIDVEISRLEKARALLVGIPSKSKSAKPKRTISADARKRIADAQRKRWAAVKAKKV
jgi:hypothetical protein